MTEPIEPPDVLVQRDKGLTVTFNDGLMAEFSLMQIRLSCPCAACRNFRDLGDDVWPRPGSEIPLRIEDAEFHGAWGIRLTWNDGHGTGIYPFELLRRWAESATT